MKKLTLVLMVVVMGVLLALPAFAFGPSEGRYPGNEKGEGKGHGYHRDAVWEKLNLSDEQKAKVEALQAANKKEVRPVREKLFDKSAELRKLWLQANPEKDKITAAQKEVRKLRDILEDKTTSLHLEIRKVLTPEQNEKLANSRCGKGMGHGPRGGMRGHGGCGQEMGSGMCQ